MNLHEPLRAIKLFTFTCFNARSLHDDSCSFDLPEFDEDVKLKICLIKVLVCCLLKRN